MHKFTLISQFVPDQLDRVNHANKITHEFEAESLDEVMEQFAQFLRGSGYSFDGHVEIVDDYPVDKDKESPASYESKG